MGRKRAGDEANYYEIRVRGRLPQRWSGFFEGLAITPMPDGETALTGCVSDQSALQGILNNLADLGLSLLLVRAVAPPDEIGK